MNLILSSDQGTKSLGVRTYSVRLSVALSQAQPRRHQSSMVEDWPGGDRTLGGISEAEAVLK